MSTETKTQSTSQNAIMICLVAGGILVGLALAFVFVSGYNPFRARITVTSYFIDSEGLKSGAAVNLNGVTIGIVKRVDLNSAPAHHKAPVQVTMKIYSRYLPGLHTDSLATVSSMGALADTFIDIDSSQAIGLPPADGAELPTLNAPTVLNLQSAQDTMNNAHQLMDKLNGLFDQVETGNGSIGQFMSNPGLTREARDTVGRFQKVTAKLSHTDSTAGRVINDHSAMDHLADISRNMQLIQGEAGKLMNGPLNANLASVSTQAKEITDDLNAGHGAAGMVLNDPKFSAEMKQTMAKANGLVASIDNGPGTAGKLLHDDQLKANLQKLSTESSTLAAMIRSNPKKYLTIKVRIF
jgi:phospholipid/cholesterol/gamma-HCH transport system substrate-binding protein